MKKYLGLIGAAVLMVALATPAAAQMLTRSWGHLEIMTVYENKPDFNTGAAYYRAPDSHNIAFFTGAQRPNQDITQRHVAERFRLGLQHGDEKTVRAVIEFEGNSSDWGEASTGTVTGGKMGTYQADQTQLQIRHAYLEFVVPNTPVTVSAGMQLFVYGGRLFVYNDAPGMKVTAKFAPHQIQAAWWRVNDDSRIRYDIHENYALEYRLTQKNFNFYAWGNYQNQNRDTATSRVHDNPYWLGVGGGFRPGNLDLSGQFIYAGGNKEDFTSTKLKKDYSAFALEAAAKYQIGPGMRAGLEAYYSTGNDANQTDKINLYPIAFNSESRAIFGIDRTVIFWMNAGQFGYWHNREIFFEGMWYGRANFEFSPRANIRFNLNYLYIGDTSKGTPGAGKSVNSPLGARQDKDEDFIGHEINLITTIAIYKNIIYNIGLGYFIPGSIYDKPATTTPAKSAENTYGINTNLKYVF